LFHLEFSILLLTLLENSTLGWLCFGDAYHVNLLDLEWSTDGARLAFTIDASVIVCTLNLQGTAVTSLRQLHIPDPSYDPSNMNTHKYSMPDGVIWSPDDYWLLASLFYVPPGMIQNSCGIAVFDVANDFAYRGKIGEEFCHVWGMSWSPDGRQLALGNGTDGYWVGTLQSE
jgi:WD40 repeat protein